MKKLLIAGLSALMVLGGCAKNEGKTPDQIEQELLDTVTGDMNFLGAWYGETDDSVSMIFSQVNVNEYDITAYWGTNESEGQSWTMHGTYDPVSGMLNYENGTYAVLKMNADGNETRENETTVSGSIHKMGEDTIKWFDDKLEDGIMLKKDPNTGGTIPTLKFAEGPFVVNDTYQAAISDEDAQRFEKAADGQIGVKYTPIQVLATQTVNGTNYLYLTYAIFNLGIEQRTYCINEVKVDGEGNVEGDFYDWLDVNNVYTKKEVGSQQPLGGWQIVDNDAEGVTTEEADEAFSKAAQTYDGDVAYLVPIILIGTAEEEAKTTYRFLVRGATEEIYPQKELFIFDIEKTQDETCTVTDVKPVDLTQYVRNTEE